LTLTLGHSLHLQCLQKTGMKADYSVKKLAKLAGVSVRTLHVYDKMGLLKPSVRTNVGYRFYNEKELLRLQQILFYKELDFPLKDITEILDSPNFDLVKALEDHKKALDFRKKRLNTLLKTLDKTINALKNKTMLNIEELYDGLSRDEVAVYRKEAIENYGQEVVERSENYLRKLTKKEMQALLAEQKAIAAQLASIKNENPESQKVQELIHLHYLNTRKLWGTAGAADKQGATYKGLGKLYLTDERFTMINGITQPDLNEFLSKAITYYADRQLS